MTGDTENKFVLTLLLYINEGCEEEFLKYEASVLPLLEKHNGSLQYRIRPPKESFIYPPGDEQPYEIHIISFRSEKDFMDYKNDPERLKHMGLAGRSIKKIRVIKAEAVKQ
jgi:hypothetical protein